MFYKETLVPFEGTKSFRLYENIDVVKKVLENENVSYTIELWESDYETVPNPWKVIVVENVVSLFFAKNDKLFKIIAWENYAGALPNGISTGMSMEEAKMKDNSLKYDDWNEDYSSQDGYWLEDNVDTNDVLSISIFIKEVLDEENFDYCNW